VAGGAGAAVLELLHAHGLSMPVLSLGLPDRFIEHGDPGKLLSMLGLDAPGMTRSIRQWREGATGSVPALKVVGN
jgi:1-deoxy-D-xylulose-5-phosphate synthase